MEPVAWAAVELACAEAGTDMLNTAAQHSKTVNNRTGFTLRLESKEPHSYREDVTK
jgi:hypothetical protein